MSKKQKHAHHGGAWKVAYADFVTAMMALFMVLWLTAQDTKVKDAVERAFRNPFSAVNKESTGIIPMKDSTAQSSSSSKGEAAAVTAIEMEMLRHITEDLARMLEEKEPDQNTVQIELTPEGLRITIFDRTHKPVFEPESDVFTTYGAWVFSTLAWEISRYQSFKIELEGHTEKKPAAPGPQRQWELTTDRANAARRKLVQSGVVPDQIFKVSGYGDTQPMPSMPPTDVVNRRVTVMLKVRNTDSMVETANAETANTPAQ